MPGRELVFLTRLKDLNLFLIDKNFLIRELNIYDIIVYLFDIVYDIIVYLYCNGTTSIQI